MTQAPDPGAAEHRNRPVLITAAPNGARRGKADHPALPVTTEEIAAEAARCQAAGAGLLHMHVRDGEGLHSLDPGRYREALDAVAEAAPGLAVQITTEAAGRYEVPAQYDCLRALAPAAASISVREIARDAALAPKVYGFAAEAGTAVQHILYDTGDLAQLRVWIADGTVPEAAPEVLLVFGRYVPPLEGTPAMLSAFLDTLGPWPGGWACCTFGGQEHAVAEAALARGGDIRIGFENNLDRPDGTRAANTAENIARAAEAAAALGRPLRRFQDTNPEVR